MATWRLCLSLPAVSMEMVAEAPRVTKMAARWLAKCTIRRSVFSMKPTAVTTERAGRKSSAPNGLLMVCLELCPTGWAWRPWLSLTHFGVHLCEHSRLKTSLGWPSKVTGTTKRCGGLDKNTVRLEGSILEMLCVLVFPPRRSAKEVLLKGYDTDTCNVLGCVMC